MSRIRCLLSAPDRQRPPATARQRWLPALHPGAVAGIEDYVMWALPVVQERLGSAGSPAAVWRHAAELTTDLPSAPRSVVAEAWRDLTVALRIGTIPPVPAWPASPVTVIGDAIHLAPGFGGNRAMRDAHCLRDALVEACHGRLALLDAIGRYEDMVRRDDAVPAAAEAGT